MTKVESDDSQYQWNACYRNSWEESNLWTKFAHHWRTQEISYDTVSRLTLVPEELQTAPMVGNMFEILSNNKDILVLDEYRIMIRRIFKRYNDTLQGDEGCVFTGQPGVGKSVLLCFLLVVLLQSKEPTPIVFYHEKGRVVFFENKAYVEKNPVSFSMYTVPLPKGRPDFPESIPHTWVLIDMGYSMEEPQLECYGYIFPVQSAQPNPAQYHHWSKRYNTDLWVFPLWTADQIHTGWTMQYIYLDFRARVQDWMNKTIPESHNPDHTNIVQTHLDQCPMVPHTSDCVDEVTTKCVNWAIERFGYSPRDVYTSLEHPSMTKYQDEAVDKALASWESAADFVQRFNATGEAYSYDIDPGRADVRARASHQIIALDVPRADFESYHYPIVYTWKSPFIEKAMMDNYLVLTEEQQARYCQILQTSDKGSVIAKPIYERHAHKFFTSKEKRFLPLQPMHRPENDDRHQCISPFKAYVTTADPAACYPELPSGLKLQEYDTNIDSIPILEGCYYKPNHRFQPLFDSFIIEKSNGSIFLDIIRFGLPDTKEEAMSGYDIINKLRDLINKKFGLPVRIRYIYASPQLLPDCFPRTWKLPRAGFIEGEVWYLGLPYPFEREQFQMALRELESRRRQKELDQMQKQKRKQEQIQANRKKRGQQELEEDIENEKRNRRNPKREKKRVMAAGEASVKRKK